MDNEYDHLREEALRRSRRGRESIIHAERKFYNAISRFREASFRFQNPKWIDEMLADLGDYPSVLRSVMDAEDDANQMLMRAMHIRRMEAFAKSVEEKEQVG